MFQPGGADVYAEIMRDLLVQYKMFCPLPDVLQQGLLYCFQRLKNGTGSIRVSTYCVDIS